MKETVQNELTEIIRKLQIKKMHCEMKRYSFKTLRAT